MQQENMKTLESLEDFRHFSEKELEIRFDQLKKQIVPADKTIREQAEKHWGHVAKPLGSLGVLEEDIVRAAAAQGEKVPDFSKRALLIFCADNGVVEERVSQTGQEVTAAVVSNMTRGRSCSCLMAEKAETDVFPIDIGIACEVEHQGKLHPLTERKIRRGTSNFTKAAAMTRQEVLTAILTGIDAVRVLKEQGYRLSAVGEMGIGNTSASSMWMTCLTGTPLEQCVGAGSGLGSAGVRRKCHVLRQALDGYAGDRSVEDVMRWFGGYEMVMAVGAMLQAAELGMVILVDGFIMTNCMLAASKLYPEVLNYAVFAHRGDESGHALLLDAMGAKPLLDLGLRLGEGTGAVCAYPIVESAVRMIAEMASFGDAGVTKYF